MRTGVNTAWRGELGAEIARVRLVRGRLFLLDLDLRRCAFRPIIKLRTRHFLERRQILDQLINAQRFTTKFFNDLLHVGSFRVPAPKYLFRTSYGRTFPLPELIPAVVKFWNGSRLRFPLASRTWSTAFEGKTPVFNDCPSPVISPIVQ